MARYLGGLLGALVITYLLSRLARLAVRARAGVGRHVLVHGLTLAVSTTLAAFGFADGGPPAWTLALVQYLPAVLVWLVVDLVREPATRART